MLLFMSSLAHLEAHTCIKVVTSVEKPKPLIMIVPKLEIPPLGMLPSIDQHVVSPRGTVQHTDNTKGEEEIQLIIQECLLDLRRFEVLILHAGLVFSDSLDSNSTLSLRQAWGSNR